MLRDEEGHSIGFKVFQVFGDVWNRFGRPTLYTLEDVVGFIQGQVLC